MPPMPPLPAVNGCCKSGLPPPRPRMQQLPPPCVRLSSVPEAWAVFHILHSAFCAAGGRFRGAQALRHGRRARGDGGGCGLTASACMLRPACTESSGRGCVALLASCPAGWHLQQLSQRPGHAAFKAIASKLAGQTSRRARFVRRQATLKWPAARSRLRAFRCSHPRQPERLTPTHAHTHHHPIMQMSTPPSP